MKTLSDQKKGSLLAFIAVMFITPDSLFIRLSNVDTWGLVFYRGAIPFFTVLIGMLIIYKADFYRNIIEGDEAVITGVVKERGRDVYYKAGYFVQLGVSDTASDEDRKAGVGGVYNSIKNKRGEPAALAFVNRRYNAYELSLREAFESKFKRYESDPAFTPEQAQEKIIEGLRSQVETLRGLLKEKEELKKETKYLLLVLE